MAPSSLGLPVTASIVPKSSNWRTGSRPDLANQFEMSSWPSARMLTANRFDVSIILYGPAVLLASNTRGYPAVGTEGFPGNLAVNRQIKTLLEEGAKIYACRFAMGALYGFREDDLIPGVRPFNPLDVLDSALTAWRAGAFQLNTWTM